MFSGIGSCVSPRLSDYQCDRRQKASKVKTHQNKTVIVVLAESDQRQKASKVKTRLGSRRNPLIFCILSQVYKHPPENAN